MASSHIILFFVVTLLMFGLSVFRMVGRLKGKLEEAGVDPAEVMAKVVHEARRDGR